MFARMVRPITNRKRPVQDLQGSDVGSGRQTRAVFVAAIIFLSQLLLARADGSFRRVFTFNDFKYISSPGIAIINHAIGLADSTYYIGLYSEPGSAGNYFIDASRSLSPIVNAAKAPIFAIDLFHWHALDRWGIKEGNLPLNSTVLLREPSAWVRTKWFWVIILPIILGLSLLAAHLYLSLKQIKLAKDARLHLSGLLINAQEKERSRIASELHDDFSQRIALLALGLENVADELPDSMVAVKQQLQKLFDSASELGADIHTVSHRLHSSTLESLGLVPGVSTLCKEFTDRHGIEIDFCADNIPRGIHKDVALCLFRIIQEGLQNLKKHSGVAKAEVKLWTSGDKILMSVSDQGRGFDLKEIANKAGLGIRSMEERARLLGGRFQIHSEPARGTRIEACISLQPVTRTFKG